MDFVYIVAGLLLLFFGGEGLLKGSVALARRFGLSDFLIGAVIVGFGTSMPELSVSVKAALDGASGIVLGNVVGSNTANILLILGLCAVICPILVNDRSLFRDVGVMVGAALVMCLIALTGVFSLIAGIGLVAALAAYVVYSYREDRRKTQKEKAETAAHIQEDTEGALPLSLNRALIYTVAGLVFLAVGATFLVEGATSIARGFGISESIIGLSLVAVGTSLPELATGVVAAMRKHTDIIIGNIVGSNIFNILFILGLSAMITPVDVSPQIARVDMWVMLGVSVLLAIVLKTGHKITRAEGGFLVALYAGYMGWLFTGAAS